MTGMNSMESFTACIQVLQNLLKIVKFIHMEYDLMHPVGMELD